MTKYHAGDVVLLPFPFTDLSTTKKRPALILLTVASKTLPALATVAMITSEVEGEKIKGDFFITHWQKSALLYSSKIRLAKLVSVETSIILGKLGTLYKEDWQQVKAEFLKLFSF